MPPAARTADPTTHGAPLAPGPGSANVLIGGMPAWRAVIDQHACPAVSVTGADGVGSVIMGSPTVLINNMMACRMGDIVIEKPGLAMGPANPIIMGEPTVEIGMVGMGSPVSVSVGLAPLMLLARAMAAPGSTDAQSVSNAAQSLARAAQGGTAVIGPSPGSGALAQAVGVADVSAFGEIPPHVVSPDKTSWIEIELIDETGEPVPDQPYQIVLPDGSTVDGILDETGQARMEGIDPGTCQITFPDMDKGAWKSD